MRPTTIEVEGISKRYRIGALQQRHDRLRDAAAAWLRSLRRGRLPGREREDFWALRDISFSAEPGEVVGVIGRNGAGKSTLLKILSRITEPTEGTARLRGRLASLLEVGVGFHPELTGRENIYLNGAIIGMRKREIAARFDEIVAFAEIERFIDTPVKRYSSGMYVRLAFAVAAHLEPEILLIDEVLAVGDVAFQKKCLGRMNDVATREGRTVLFVSHNMGAVRSLCTRGILLEGGRIVHQGPIAETVDRYLRLVGRDEQTEALRDRTDRQGSGRLRFTKIEIRTPEGPKPSYLTGDELLVELWYEAESPLKDVSVSIPFYTLEGQTIFMLWTRLLGQNFESLPPTGKIVGRIPRLPLRSGRYLLNLWCEVGGVLSDWVQEAAMLDVENGDFFRRNLIPPTQGVGVVVIPHEFSHEPV